MRRQTNADRIRQMADEELADIFWECLCDSMFVNPYKSKDELIAWLKQEVNE